MHVIRREAFSFCKAGFKNRINSENVCLIVILLYSAYEIANLKWWVVREMLFLLLKDI